MAEHIVAKEGKKSIKRRASDDNNTVNLYKSYIK